MAGPCDTGAPAAPLNADSINRRIAALPAAYRAVQDLKLEPLTSAELEARLMSIRQSLPEIEEMEVARNRTPAPRR